MDTLSILFASEARIKIMRLFLFNEEKLFDLEAISQKSKVNTSITRKEINLLQKSKLLKTKSFFKAFEKKRGKKITEVSKRVAGFYLNKDFIYIEPLRKLLISTEILKSDQILKRFAKAGKLKLVIVSGVFTEDKDSRLDILVVGNNINRTIFNNVIKEIEAEIGKELVYAYFEMPDFQYRLSMYDKLIRDVLDYPHRVLLDKLTMEGETLVEAQ